MYAFYVFIGKSKQRLNKQFTFFSVLAAQCWNELPADVRTAVAHQLRKSFKPHLFTYSMSLSRVCITSPPYSPPYPSHLLIVYCTSLHLKIVISIV